MFEDVRDLPHRGLLVNELGGLQTGKQAVEFIVGFSRYRSNQSERELLADYRQRLQQVLLLGWQPIDTRGQHRLNRRWDLNRIERFGELDRAVANQRALLEQRLHDLFDEERIALGLLENQAFERREFAPVVEQRVQHFLAGLGAERIEPQLRVVGFVAPVVSELGPVVDQHQNPRRAERFREQVEQRV